MRNKLYTNGCSFTYGHVPNDDAHNTEILRAYHAQPCNWTWAGHLGNHFSEFVNESWAGGSNLRMLRRTFDFFNKVEDPSNWIAIIQLTDPYRFEYFDNVVQHYAGVVHDAPLLDDSVTDSKTIELYCEEKYPLGCFIGASELVIEWVDVNREFRIDEYDGNESIIFRDNDDDWITA